MPRVSQQYKDDQRAQILDAARRCFVRNGFHQTSMQDVFTEAGKSAGAVYRYFPSKEAMIVATATQNLEDVGDVLRAAVAAGTGRGLGPVLAELLDAVAARHAEHQLAAVALMVWSESLRDQALADRLRESIAAMSADLADLVRERQQAGDWAGGAADQVAPVLLSILPGFLLTLALRGPRAVSGFPDAVRALWPA
ncbi:TetR/AcrR family transcriptional regulator [Amycolatopsis sp. CA-230715]|uniref:TetR/AcrR family transcriptional regulator n=1 Tax=Amycolatopsis sp. CA-230715 TaxID=2745196 RepID=UPI001C023C19|nr:TetR/AcrR family transcriptional regulator [Amycolatopsis sp. CA-230715]QWF77785.1 HTH-type transcriptional regulator BetI [Amycolatopsis sp. CA-230715]